MALGILARYSPAKCYGFIKPLDGGADVFLHVTELQRAGIHGIQAGQYLTFNVASTPSDPRPTARKVALAPTPAAVW